MAQYNFARNNPYDRQAEVLPVLADLIPSRDYMKSIRAFKVPAEALAIWLFGQNGFLLKGPTGPLIGIDLYLTDSCAIRYAALPFRLNRQLPIFVEPEDLDVDIFLTTHSHDDHADPETIRRLSRKQTIKFVGPWDSVLKYIECGVSEAVCTLIHPNQTIRFDDAIEISGTFALPTDSTDLNHTGTFIRFANGVTFYNTGDTGYCRLLESLLPRDPDICAICINGGFNNLDPMEAARIVKAVNPRIALPCHYDMMINNIGDPNMFRVCLDLLGSRTQVHILDYYTPWLFYL